MKPSFSEPSSMGKESDMYILPNLPLSWKSDKSALVPKVKDLGHPEFSSSGMAKCVRHSLSSCFYPFLFLGLRKESKKARQSGWLSGHPKATFPTVALRGTVTKHDSRSQIAIHGSRDFCWFVWEPDLSIKVIELFLN